MVDSQSFHGCSVLLIAVQKVYVRWDVCWVNEEFDLLRCFKCLDFQHTRENCKNKTCCPKCGGEHEIKNCTPDIENSCVCVSNAETSDLQLECAHNVWSDVCPTLSH